MHNIIIASLHQSWHSTKKLFQTLVDSIFSCQTCHQMLQNSVCDAAALATALVPMLTIVD